MHEQVGGKTIAILEADMDGADRVPDKRRHLRSRIPCETLIRNLAKTLVITSTLLAPSLCAAKGFNAGAFLGGMAEEQNRQQELELQRKQIELQQAQERERAQQRYDFEQQRLQLQRQQQEIDRLRMQQQNEQLRQQRVMEQQRLAEEKARKDAEEAKRTAIATGTGFFVTSDGYVVTNYHVIEDKGTFAVRDIKGVFYRASVIQRDPVNDLALLKVEGRFPALRIGNSDGAVKGQRVLAVGYPHISVQGNESKVTDGIINSLSGYKGEASNFQISVPVQGGNSGGPLVSESGMVYGVIVAKLSAASGDLLQNVSYAIKSKVLLNFLETSGVKNTPTVPTKTNIAAVDSATVLVVARNGALDFPYQTSPAERAADAKARQEEEAKRMREAALAEKARQDAEAQRTRDAADRMRPPAVALPSADRYVSSTSMDEVTDTKTGMIWRRCVEGMRWSGSSCVGSYAKYSYDEALEYAETEARRTGKAWRVPSKNELTGIVDKAERGPAIEFVAFPATPNTWFWSSSLVAENPGSAEVVNSGSGYSSYDYRGSGSGSGNALRLVRIAR